MEETPNRPNTKRAKTHTAPVVKTNWTSKAKTLPEEQIPNRSSERTIVWIYKDKDAFSDYK